MLKRGSYATYIGNPFDSSIAMLIYRETCTKIIKPFSVTRDTNKVAYIVELVDGTQALLTRSELIPCRPKPSWLQIESNTNWRPIGLKI